MIFRFVGAKLLEAIGAIVGIVLFPIVFALRFKIDNKKWYAMPLWYLSNQDESSHIENWYGFYELRPEVSNILLAYNRMSPWEKFKMSFEWVALRNPTWQLKLAIGKHLKGDIDDIKVHMVEGSEGGFTFRNKWITGAQYCTFFIGDYKCFRYSFTKQIFGRWVNVMLGAKEGRYVSKFRIFKELGRWG